MTCTIFAFSLDLHAILTFPADVKIAHPGFLHATFGCFGYLVFTTFRRLINGDGPFGCKNRRLVCRPLWLNWQSVDLESS